MKDNIKGSVILVFVSALWGFGFVAQSGAAGSVPPFMVSCLRSVVSTVFLYALFKALNRKTKEPIFPKEKPQRKIVIVGGLACGIMLAVSSNFQQFGISFYPKSAPVEAHAGFITALYVLIVPIISVFMKKYVSPVVWVAAAVALGGFYMLCLSEGPGRIYFADFLVLLCALCFSLHIIVVDKYVGEVGGIRLSLLQFAVCSVVSGVMSFMFELDKISLDGIISAALPLLYLGVVSSGIAYTLQIIGQRYAEPSVASLAMSLESVFAAIGGWLMGGVVLTRSEFIGCALVFAAIIIAQLPEFFSRKTQTVGG